MTNLLIALVVLLTIAAMVQLVRVNELLSEITNKDTNEVTDEDNNQNGILFIIIGFGFLAFVIWQMITWDHLLLPPSLVKLGVGVPHENVVKVKDLVFLLCFL